MQHAVSTTGALRLSEVLGDARIHGESEVRFQSCCSQWQACRPGDLFVALVGAEHDGHDDVHQAIRHGATAVVAERLLPIDVPCCVVPDTREALGQICQRLAGRPGEQLRVTAITGTYGKTTTAVLASAVLAARGRQVGMTSSLGYYDCETTAIAAQATPEPPELARWLSRMVTHGCQDAVVEVSSQALAQRHVAGLKWDAAILTSLGRDHLNFHGTTGNYFRAKLSLFHAMKPDGVAIVNLDDPVIERQLDQISAPLLTVGIDRPAEIQAVRLEQHGGEQLFLLTAGQESVPVRTRTVGDTFIRCCLSAVAMGLVYGVDLETSVRAIESVDHVPGRLQRIECGQEFGVYVDYARSPQTLALALQTVRQVTPGRVICVAGATQWDDDDDRAATGRVLERGADLAVITSNHPGHESSLQIAHAMLDGFRRPGPAHVIPDREKAIHWSLSQARPGDSVVITGKGHEQFQLLGNHVTPFDDAEVARLWLRGYRPELSDRSSTISVPFRRDLECN